MDQNRQTPRAERLQAAATQTELLEAELTKRVLEERARRLAQPLAAFHDETGGRFLVFGVQSDLYAVPLEGVREVLRQPRIASVPGAAAEVAGLVQIRGEVVPVYDVAHLRTGTRKSDAEEPGVVVLVQLQDRRAGLLVSDVAGISTRTELENTVTVLDIHSLIGEEQ